MVSTGFMVVWWWLVLWLQSFLLQMIMVTLAITMVLAIMCLHHILSTCWGPCIIFGCCIILLLCLVQEGLHANTIITMPLQQQEQFHNQPGILYDMSRYVWNLIQFTVAGQMLSES